MVKKGPKIGGSKAYNTLNAFNGLKDFNGHKGWFKWLKWAIGTFKGFEGLNFESINLNDLMGLRGQREAYIIFF